MEQDTTYKKAYLLILQQQERLKLKKDQGSKAKSPVYAQNVQSEISMKFNYI